MAPNDYVLVATVARDDATTTLFFGRLRDRVPIRFTELVPRSPRHALRALRAEMSVAADLAGAGALVVSRGLFEFTNLVQAGRSLGIPCFYFMDDNFMVLRDERHADAQHARLYAVANVRDALTAFDGVLCATVSLRDFFLENRLHERVELYPPISIGPPAPHRRHHDDLRIAFFGGAHRREPFVRIVVPAIRALAQHRVVTLFAAGLEGVSLDDADGLKVVLVEYDRDYTAALDRMARHDIDILVHPSSETANNRYKNPHVLINARTLGAAPIFSTAPPYDSLAGEGVCLLAEDTERDWLTALTTLTDRNVRAQMSTKIIDYCDEHFGGETNVRSLTGIIGDERKGQRKRRAPLLALKLAGGLVMEMARRAIPARS